jgi:hypothetical protein
MSWKPEVQIEPNGKWCGNGLRFATRDEAMSQVSDLAYRWTSVHDMRVVEDDNPVNYAYVDHKLVEVKL